MAVDVSTAVADDEKVNAGLQNAIWKWPAIQKTLENLGDREGLRSKVSSAVGRGSKCWSRLVKLSPRAKGMFP